MTTVFPLIACTSDVIDTHVVAYRKGVVITSREFLGDVYTLAKNLPAAKHYLNACTDRYYITLLLAAVMLRDALSLLPPNTTAETLQQLKQQFSDICVLTDHHKHSFEGAVFLPELLGVKNDCVNTPTLIPYFPAEQIAGVLFTSGSTGHPMPNKRTWGALCQSVRLESKVLGLNMLGGGAPVVILGTVPAQHSYGLESTVMLPLQTGHAFSTDHSFYPADIALSLANMPYPRVLVTTPFHLRLLLESQERFPEIDLIISATAPLSPQLAQGIEQQLRTTVCEIYGCTEAGPVATRRTTSSDFWTLFPYVELDKRGSEAWVSGGHVGDVCRLHDEIEICGDNTFRLLGRTGDMINIAGKRTSLAHLNFHLNSIVGVDDGLFLAPEDYSDGTSARLMAFVVSPSLTAEQILGSLRDRIDPAFLPRPLHVVDFLPRNATGKINMQDIRRLIESK
jgi:acyl-coenzyme A synthetase/AMP-(fatty) acid ligase